MQLQLHWHHCHIVVCERPSCVHQIVHCTNAISTSCDAMWSPVFLFIYSILSPYALFAILYSTPKVFSSFVLFRFVDVFFLAFGFVLLARWQKCNGRTLQFMFALFPFFLTYLTLNTRMPLHAGNIAYMCWIFPSFFVRSCVSFLFSFHFSFKSITIIIVDCVGLSLIKFSFLSRFSASLKIIFIISICSGVEFEFLGHSLSVVFVVQCN